MQKQDSQHNDCCSSHTLEHGHAEHAGHNDHAWKTAAHATLHCLTGCMIGELLGLVIGVSFALHPYVSMSLSTMLAYVSGFSFTLFPLMKRAGFGFRSALKAVWLGEVISIGVMELVMNSIDYHMGGVRSGSVFNPLFWEALAVAVPAGYLAAFPVNYWLIGKEMKRCH